MVLVKCLAWSIIHQDPVPSRSLLPSRMANIASFTLLSKRVCKWGIFHYNFVCLKNIVFPFKFLGPHKIDVLYDGVPVPGSPFPVTGRRGCDPRKVKAFGPGLERGIVNQPNIFTIETKGAGTGGLGLAIEGPSEAKMTCRDNRDGSCTVEYVPTEAGDYDISIKFADQFIPGSPFKVCYCLPQCRRPSSLAYSIRESWSRGHCTWFFLFIIIIFCDVSFIRRVEIPAPRKLWQENEVRISVMKTMGVKCNCTNHSAAGSWTSSSSDFITIFEAPSFPPTKLPAAPRCSVGILITALKHPRVFRRVEIDLNNNPLGK